MTEEAIVRFHANGVEDAVAKVGAALKGVGLTAEPPGGRMGIGGNVVVSIFKASWDAADKAALRAALEAQGLPGTYDPPVASAHGYV